ncbi:insulinase family protein [Pontibacter sp. JH31]|uniref:Insulinase family protein n=1 Tax=Pontibacter aquaedesilientis TaxID=2766980 RepID=A0ABR7XDL5_9BACT|nr:pitrilysin family protein [Pontibacter aquaedesilientis]MBD1396375.1 insulinase family protein [Pontibacter aquaedesilientis]
MNKKIFKLALGVLLTLQAGIATAQKQAPPSGGDPKDFKLPAKQQFDLPNGLTATMVPYGEVPKVTVSMVVEVGNVHETENQNGLADMVGNLLQEGTATRNARQLAEEVARLGGSLYVSVGPNQTWISGSVLSEYGPELIGIMADLVKNPAFPESELARVKNDFKRQMNLQRQQPGAQAQEKYRAVLYPNHPYGRKLPTDAEIDQYTLEQLRDFYQKQFGADRTNVYVAGKFDAGAMKEAISSTLRDWNKGPEPQIPVAKPVTKGDMIVVDRPGAPQSTIVFGLPVVDPSHPDYMALRVTNSLLGGSFGSRITRNIREDKGYTYSPYSSLAARYKVGDWAQVADVTTEHTGNSLREIVREISRLGKEAPTAEELEGIKNYEAGLFVLRNSSPNGIISQLSFLDLHGLPESFLTNQVQHIHAITPQQVQQTTQKYIRPKDMTLVVVGDRKQIDSQLKKFQSELMKNPL